MPAGLGQHNAGTEGDVAARSQGTLLSVRQNLRPNSWCAGLGRYRRYALVRRSLRLSPIGVRGSGGRGDPFDPPALLALTRSNYGTVAREKVMARLLSVNVGLPRDITWRGKTVH